MVKSLILLVILVTIQTVLSDIEDTEKEFIYIGSFKTEARTQGLRRNGFDENNYYISVHPTTWSNAEDDCRYVFGGINGQRKSNTLVAIESVEEWEFLKNSLKDHEGTYWTSGIYDLSKNKWKWSVNNQILPPFAPWDTGFPSNPPHGRLRVLVFTSKNLDAKWRTLADTQIQRYICEAQQTTLSMPCYATNDLVVVLDSSGNIKADNFEKTKDFVDKLIKAFTVHKRNRIGLLTYSTTATKIIDITNTFTSAEFSSIIRSVNYTGGWSDINLGIDLAVAQFNSSPRQVPLNVVVLTDSYSNKTDLTNASATRAINMGIRLFSVGITPSDSLLAIAGGNSKRVFTTTNFDNLIELLAPVSTAVCPNDITQISKYDI